jgi:ElaA protein
MSLEFTLDPFDTLALPRWYAISQARTAVFIVEQNCPYQDLDGKDRYCSHLCAWDGDRLAAYLRIVPPGVSYAEASLGRVLTTADYRRGGFGKRLLREGIDRCEQLHPGPIRIGAQRYLEAFYASFGFRTVSEPYDEDGIEHVLMLRD